MGCSSSTKTSEIITSTNNINRFDRQIDNNMIQKKYEDEKNKLLTELEKYTKKVVYQKIFSASNDNIYNKIKKTS